MGKKKNKSWLSHWRLLLVALFTGLSSVAWGQEITQNGMIKDQAGEPIIGASVMIKGSKNGVATDIDGNFALKCKSGSILQITSIGYKPLEVMATGKPLDLIMEEDTEELDEVVVVGYGTMSKKHIAGSMSTIDEKLLEEKSPVSVLDALQGAALGLQIISNSGAPGASSFVSMRGASTFSDEGVAPLFVVDGVIVNTIDDISPNDIKRIDVMRDAATSAIYGARAANGVIFITTKSGEQGKPRVDAKYQRSYYTASNKLPQVNAFESRLSMAASDLNNSAKTLEKFGERTDSVGLQYSTNYYYQDLLLQTAPRDEATVQVSGGTKEFLYRISLGYVGQEGIVRTSYNDRYTANLNVEYNPWKNIKFITRMRLSYNKRNNIKESVFQDAMRRDPDMIIWYPDGELIPYYSSGGRRNPIAELTEKLDETSRYEGQFYQGLAWTFTPWLKLDANISANYSTSRRVVFSSKTLEGSNNGKNTGSDLTQQQWKYAGEAYLTFNKKFGDDHQLTVVAGSSFETTRQHQSMIGGSYFLSEYIHYMNMATVYDLRNVYTSGWDEAMIGLFARGVYSWKGRYTLTGIVRRDGSSRFGKNNRWGVFPSVSAAWRFSDEPWMRWSVDVLSDAKLRASYGVTGNDRIGHYESQTVYNAGSTYNGVGSVVPGSKYGNPNLKWEETKQTNIGIDLSFWGGRAVLTADFYIKKTSDLLADQNLPYTTGYNSTRINLAGIENKGIELSVTAIPIRNRNFNWSTTINWWKNNNKITKLAREDYIANTAWWVGVGQPAGLWYGYKNLGVYEYDASNAYTSDYSTRLTPVFERDDDNNVIIGLNGQPTLVKYLMPDGSEYDGEVTHMKTNGVIVGGGDVIWYNKPDENGNYDGEINTNDQIILGDATPDWYGSWYNTLQYKNFSLSLNFYVSWGGKVWNDLKRYYSSWGGNTHKQTPEYILQGWKYPGEITEWYALNSRARSTNNHSMSLSSQFLEDASFIRLQNLRLSYNLEKKIVEKTPFRSVQAYIYGNNLVTWTNYSGFDPEVSGSVLTPGKDSSKYPHSREMGFGINVGL